MRPNSPNITRSEALASLRPLRWRPAAALCLAFGVALAADVQAQSRCVDDSVPEPLAEGSVATVAPADPRETLRALVRRALERSQTVGAARLLAEAAQADLEDAKATGRTTISANAFLGGTGTDPLDGSEGVRGRQGRVGLVAGATLWDSGRVDRLVEWRTQLAESARLGHLTAEEQIALQTVSLAIERSRYRLQTQIYRQYERKMACLVEGLESIVRADRGRASELVQAQKSVQQADLAQQAALAALRQTEIRLRRFVGDNLPEQEGYAGLLSTVPPLDRSLAEAEAANDLAQLAASAEAQARLAEAVQAGQGPQVAWTAATAYNRGVGASRSWSVGLTVAAPLLNPAADPQITAARKRADAVRQQRDDAVVNRRYRVMDLHDQANAAFDRARRTADVLRDSERVRGFTLLQWRQLGRRSLFDVMSAESEHYQLRTAHVNALVDGQQANVQLLSLGRGLVEWLR